MASPEVQKLFAAEGADIVQMSTRSSAPIARDEIVKWGRVVKQAGIKAHSSSAVPQVTKVERVINLKTAKTLGLTPALPAWPRRRG